MRFGVAQSAVDERLEVHVADLADTAATSTKVIHLWSVAVSGSTEDVAIDGLGVGGVCVTEAPASPSNLLVNAICAKCQVCRTRDP